MSEAERVVSREAATARAHLVTLVESVLTMVLHVTRIVREGICDALFRDTEELHGFYISNAKSSLLFVE